MPALILALVPLLSGPCVADDADPLLFEFDRRSDGIAAEIRDPTPRLRVYASGRLLVYFPIYMKRAGLWEAWLSPGELRKLLDALSARGVFSLDGAALERAATAAQRTGAYTWRSEAVTSRFRSHIAAKTVGAHQLTVRNLQSRSRVLSLPGLTDLADAERLLLALSESDRLVRIAPAKGMEGARR